MCDTCGCQENPIQHGENNALKSIDIAGDILQRNKQIAAGNKTYFDQSRVLTINLMGSPGCGKTTFITQTIEILSSETGIHVIEGDQFGSLDADRIKKTGVPVVQINTGNGCHLEAKDVEKAAKEFDLHPGDLLLIENVGNLVCPALFDLGEHLRVVMWSITEGEDKPLKYAPMFHSAHVCLINKADLLDHIPFHLEQALENLKKVNHALKVFFVSALRVDAGMKKWVGFLKQKMPV